jgi:hypothetical protein
MKTPTVERDQFLPAGAPVSVDVLVAIVATLAQVGAVLSTASSRLPF